MKMKILIMGLPGAGKTTLASKLVKKINAKWLNADQVRKDANDFDFSEKGRERQATRMANLAENFNKKGFIVVADFICPTPDARKLFNPDYIIWLDTIKKGRFEDTNNIFVKPTKYDVRITEKNAEFWSEEIAKKFVQKKNER